MIEERTPRRTKRVVIVLVLSIMASSALLGGALYVKAKQDNALQAGLVEGCEKNGNTVRKTVRSILQSQIEQAREEVVESRQFDLDKFFPQFTEAELDALQRIQGERVHNQNDKRREQKKELHPVDCEAQYK